MRVLLLDTCGALWSAALADSELAHPVVSQVRMPGRTASESLVAVVRQMLVESEWRLADLAAIGVVTGPGSFTGVRVGLSAAKGLGEAKGTPLIAASRLALLAAGADLSDGGKVCALLDAGRGEFYCGEYEAAMAIDEALLSREYAIAAASRAGAAVVCEEAVARALGDAVALQILDDPTAADALTFVLTRLAEGRFDDPITLDANYLRRTDSEIFAKPVPHTVS